MAKQLNLCNHRQTYTLTLEKLEEYLKFMFKYDLFYVEDLDIERSSISGYFGIGYTMMTDEEDKLIPDIDVTLSRRFGEYENFVMNGFPKCFLRLGIDLEGLSDFFNDGEWDFEFSGSWDWSTERDVDDLNYYVENIEIDKIELKCSYQRATSYITIDDSSEELNCVDIWKLISQETKSYIITCMYEYFGDYLEEHASENNY